MPTIRVSWYPYAGPTHVFLALARLANPVDAPPGQSPWLGIRPALAPTTTSFDDDTVTPGITYTYALTAIDRLNNQRSDPGVSNAITVPLTERARQLATPAPPAAPQGLTATVLP